MSTTIAQPEFGVAVDDNDAAIEYRSIHTGAIAGMLLGVLSVAVVFAARSSLESALMLLPIPLFGLAISLIANRTIRQNSHQYVGRPAAVIGMLLSLVFGIGGALYAGVVYATEVPDGFARISFLALKPDRADEIAGRPVPTKVLAHVLAGEPVFIKGYIRPDTVTGRKNVSEFLLVRDSNACCFGDLSKVKYYDQIQVNLADGLTTDFHEGRLYRLGGQLFINPQNLGLGPGYPVYTMVGTHVED
jgi:hypothetical protein